MKYCASQTCPQERYFTNDEDWCSICQQELTPCIQCLCQHWMEYNPKNRHENKACPGCGERFSDDYLGRCMSQQLAGMVREIAVKKSVEAVLN